MSARNPVTVLMPSQLDAGETFSVSTAIYRTQHELRFYLKSFEHLDISRLVIVVAVHESTAISLSDLPRGSKLILTAASIPATDSVGWFVPDPFRAVALAMTGRDADDGVILLFPADWKGESPEELVERARRWRSSPHSAVDDEYF